MYMFTRFFLVSTLLSERKKSPPVTWETVFNINDETAIKKKHRDSEIKQISVLSFDHLSGNQKSNSHATHEYYWINPLENFVAPTSTSQKKYPPRLKGTVEFIYIYYLSKKTEKLRLVRSNERHWISESIRDPEHFDYEEQL